MAGKLKVLDYEYYYHQGSRVPISMIINSKTLKENTIITINKTAFIIEDKIEETSKVSAKYNVGILHTSKSFYSHKEVDYKNKIIKCWENITVDEFDMIVNMMFSINGDSILESNVIHDENNPTSAFEKLYVKIKQELK